MRILSKTSLVATVIAFFAFVAVSFSGVDCKILNSNAQELRLKVTFNIDDTRPLITENGFQTILPIISGVSPIENAVEGAPYQGEYLIPISVPYENGYRLKNFKVIKNKTISGVVSPNPHYYDKDGFSESSYNLNIDKYHTQKINFDNVQVSFAGISGLAPIASVKISPINYNNESKTIQIIEEIELTIEFSSIGANTSSNQFRKPATINSKDVPNWTIPQVIKAKNKNGDVLMGENPNNWVKITIDREGLYSITPSMLNSLGVNISKDKLNTIKIYGYGGKELSEKVSDGLLSSLPEQEIIVNTNSDGSLNNILFYASSASGFDLKNGDITHYINHYTYKNYYLLSWDGEIGKRAVDVEPPTGEVVNTPTTYNQRIFSEDELNLTWNSGMGRQWLGRSMFPYSAVNQLYNLDRTAKVKFKINLAQNLDTGNNGIFKIYENNNLVNTCVISGIAADVYRSKTEFEISGSAIASDNMSNLKIEYSNSKATTSATPYIDWYEISYPRSFSAIDNELSYISVNDNTGITEFTMNNFNGNIYGWDVSNLSSPKLLKNLSHTGSLFICKADIKYGQVTRYFVSSNIRTPQIERINLADLRTTPNTADIIVITHRDLLESAQNYVDYRNSKNELKARLVFVDDIFNEFACGIADPTAIRNFIQYLYFNSEHKPGYILLWGDGHFDYKNITTKTVNYVIPYETEDDLKSFSDHDSYTSDDYYVWISGDDNINDLPIGRMPVTSNQVGNNILNKIKIYENSSSTDGWRTLVTLLSDDSMASGTDTNGSTHTAANEAMYRTLPIDVNVDKIYMVNYPVEYVGSGRRKPKVTEDLVSHINTSGTVLLNYIGHGNPRVLAHEEVFDRDKTTSLFKNINKLFFFTAATCDFLRFDHTDIQCGAEELIKYPLGGAIGAFAATRSINIGSGDNMLYHLYSLLLSVDPITHQPYRLGDAILNSKAIFHSYSDDLKFNLLGDPSMRLNIPSQFVSIDSVNGVCTYTSEDTLNLKGLNKVTVKGRILNSDSTFNPAFNGIGLLSMYDASEKVKAIDIDNSIHTFDKIGAALNKTSLKIVNGSFESEFYIPKDISYAVGLSKITMYAYDTVNSYYANGGWDKIKVSGIDETASVEENGPQINIFMDSRQFKSGDLVCATPLLIADIADDTGINTTGAGIGHKIEAWIDDNENIDLTQYFNCNTENPKAGFIEKVLYDLSQGNHTLKIRAWDVFNNYSVSFTNFRIGNPKDGIIISNTFASPNPTTGEANIIVIHNAPTAYSIRIDIYSESGNLVKSVSNEMTDVYKSVIPISGYDNSNKIMSQGAYYYTVTINTRDQSGIGYGSFIIVK